MHETMCSADDSHLTLEFDDHYVIQPTINFSTSINYKVNSLNETGSSVSQGFEYSSENNSKWLKPQDLMQMIHN